MDYFELLNFERIYKIDFSLLHQRYLEIQMKYHPDKATNNKEKERYLVISATLNKAYTTLKDDLTRAEYLLFLKGLSNNTIESNIGMTTDLIAKIWSELEKLEKFEKLEELEEFYNQKINQRKAIVNNISQAFAQEQLLTARDNTIELRYLNNLISNIKVKIENANIRN